MAKIKLPRPDDLAIEPLLGSLTILKVALMTVARALRGAHPEIDRAQWPREAPATLAARSVVDDCESILMALDHYRDHLRSALRDALSPDIPF